MVASWDLLNVDHNIFVHIKFNYKNRKFKDVKFCLNLSLFCAVKMDKKMRKERQRIKEAERMVSAQDQ